MIVSHLLLILHKKIQFYIFMFEAWNVAKCRNVQGGWILSQGTVHYTRGIGRHNVSNLIYVPLTAMNAYTYIVCSIYVPIDQIYVVRTDAVGPSRNSPACSSPCTNINNMRISTSAKLPSKALKTRNHRRKVLKIAHVNMSLKTQGSWNE